MHTVHRRDPTFIAVTAKVRKQITRVLEGDETASAEFTCVPLAAGAAHPCMPAFMHAYTCACACTGACPCRGLHMQPCMHACVCAHRCVPLQGSGTYAVEAMLTQFVPRDATCLVLANGAYST